jgi:hypothetical protein
MDITGITPWGPYRSEADNSGKPQPKGSFYWNKEQAGQYFPAGLRTESARLAFQASRAWTGTTNTAQPQTVNLGSGQALDITPSYYTVHMWLRLT